MELLVWAFVVAWLGWLAYRRSLEGVASRAKRNVLLEKIVDRFSSAEELLAFIRSSEGRLLLDEGSGELNPRRSVLRFIQSGILISSIGTGFLLNAMRLAGARDINDIREAAEMNYWGTAGIALGTGLLIAAAVSWAMARRWGMLERER